MLNNLLNILPNENGNWYFDNLGEAAFYAIIGFLVVFAGIVIIIGIIWLVGFILRKTDNLAFFTKKKTKNTAEKPKSEQTQLTEGTQADAVKEDDGEIPDEVKAAIIAAIMAYYEQEQPKCEFTVKRIKRI